MEITLNHTIVPSYDKVKSAEFYTRIFGFKYIGKFSRFEHLLEILTTDYKIEES